MDNLEIAKALFGNSGGSGTGSKSGGQTTTAYGIATSDSVNGIVRVNLGGDTVSQDDDQTLEVETTFAVFEGDEVIVSLVGADGTGKAPVVIGVVGRGDQQQTEINSVTNYVWDDSTGLHISTEERSVQGANILMDSDSLDIRYGNSNNESDQTVYASFGREVTVGSRLNGHLPSTVGQYSQVFGRLCTASGEYAHADGYGSKATGDYSHAEGYAAEASGEYAHAEGSYAKAQADYSHAEGMGTVTGTGVNNRGQHVQGCYNVETDLPYLDVIGNGSTSGRANAYNLDWNGNAEFQGEVYVGGCTPNGETPYPVVRYNTSNAKEEYYDGSAWAQVPNPGGGKWAQLWSNDMSGSYFPEQTVNLDLSDYSVIAITFKPQQSSSDDYAIVCFAMVGSKTIVAVPNFASTQYFYKRTVTVNSTGVTFTTGYRNTSSTTSDNYCVPMAIYGVC